MTKKIIAILCVALLAGSSRAAVINWEMPVDVSAASDVITEGTLVEAINAGSTNLGNLTVNGVTFISDDSRLSQSAVTERYSGDTGDLNYNTILDSLDWTSNGAKVEFTLGGGNLVIGVEYKIQVWYADTSKPGRILVYGDGEVTENTVTLNASGQYAIGAFIADGTTQTLTSDGLNDTFNPHLTAYQIREFPATPSTGYDRWAAGWSTNIGAATNDFDLDGLNNLYEYGLDGNPTNPVVLGTLPSFSNADSGLLYIHPKRSDDTNLLYTVETTANLVDGAWTNEGYTVLGTNVTGGTLDFVTNEVETVEDERFIRLKIEQ